MRITEHKLQIVSDAIDKMSEWALSTLNRLSTNRSMLIWLRSTSAETPSTYAYKLPQEPATVKNYINHWKQLMYYVLRTALLDEATREEVYGIKFEGNQLVIIAEILKLLEEFPEMPQKDGEDDNNDFDDDEDLEIYDYNSDEDENEDYDDDDGGDQNIDENMDENEDANGIGDDDEILNGEYSKRLTILAEKFMELSIVFIKQEFEYDGRSHNSPLCHFADVLGISNLTGRFKEAYNYTSHIAAMMWMIRLWVLEYVAPSRNYITLNCVLHRPNSETIQRLRKVHKTYLTKGSFTAMDRFIQILDCGREVVISAGRPALLNWDEDYKSVQIKQVNLKMDEFRKYVRDGVQRTKAILKEKLFFGRDLPEIDLKSLTEKIGESRIGYSFMTDSKNIPEDGLKDLENMMYQASADRHLINDEGEIERKKLLQYLDDEEEFLEGLMKGIVCLFVRI